MEKSRSPKVRDWLLQSISSLDDLVDLRWRRLKQRMGWDGVPRIQPYIGFANEHFAWVHGRVLSNPPRDLPDEDDRWWDNLLQMYQRFESDEVVGVTVEIEFAGARHRVVTDSEGYFHLETPNVVGVQGCQLWKSITMRIVDDQRIGPDESTTVSKMLTPPSAARFGMISDVDDTVLHTGIAGLLTAARLTFLHNARTRKPLPGVAALYRAMQQGNQLPPECHSNPIFYVSSSPWNLFDLLEDFLDLNDIPSGPILLRDLGFDRNKFLKEGHDHKLEKATRIMSAFPQLPFVLFGDSGQEDARLYAEAARQRPQQIKAIFIRDVDPHIDSPLDSRVQASVEVARSVGVPMHVIPNSCDAAEILLRMGWIHEASMAGIEADTLADKSHRD
ncbi:MAG: App1 family protein [Planctomycetaceae bacterium]